MVSSEVLNEMHVMCLNLLTLLTLSSWLNSSWPSPPLLLQFSFVLYVICFLTAQSLNNNDAPGVVISCSNDNYVPLSPAEFRKTVTVRKPIFCLEFELKILLILDLKMVHN